MKAATGYGPPATLLHPAAYFADSQLNVLTVYVSGFFHTLSTALFHESKTAFLALLTLRIMVLLVFLDP